jgi:hypothetical protein
LRNRQQTASTTDFKLGHLQIDLAARSVKVRGQQLKLARTEYALLRYFVHHAGRVITHSQLMQELWKLNDIEKVGLLRVHIAHLREKIETDPAKPELLITVPGIEFPRMGAARRLNSQLRRSGRCYPVGDGYVIIKSYNSRADSACATELEYPERFAQEAPGRNSKAVHRAYARRAQVKLPSLESYERQAADGRITQMPQFASEMHQVGTDG